MTYAILLCRKKEPSESSDTLPQIEQVLMQALHELRTQIISPMTDELKTDKEEDADELFQQHIEAQCKRLRILGFTGTPNNPRESKRNGQVTTTIVANGL